MNLLIDARKKSRQAAQPETGAGQDMPAPQAGDQARHSGLNLFAAKSPQPMAERTLPNRNLPYALSGTILLLAVGTVYSWHLDFTRSTASLRAVDMLPALPLARDTQPVVPGSTPVAPPEPQSAPMPGQASREARAIAPALEANAPLEKPQSYSRVPASSDNPPIYPEKQIYPDKPMYSDKPAFPEEPTLMDPQTTAPAEPLLMNAYLAYRSGKLDEARQRYLAIFEKDARNPDVLLGLGAIAQQQGANRLAAQYFGRVLLLDPRNAAANAGMAALSADEDYSESRMKNLLREQSNSTVLHFALGNLYARQSRWGEAQQAYFNAHRLEPGNAESAFNLAVSLEHLGMKSLAAHYYRHAMQLDASHDAGFDHAQISRRIDELAR